VPDGRHQSEQDGRRSGHAEQFAGGNYGANFLVFGNPPGDPNGRSTFQKLTDGTSNIVFFGERYIKCGTCPSGGEAGCWSPLWADANADWRPDICRSGTFATPPNCPLFQSGVPWNNGCVRERAQTLHSGSMVVGMGDGTVRMVSAGLTAAAWGMLCDPRDGGSVTLD